MYGVSEDQIKGLHKKLTSIMHQRVLNTELRMQLFEEIDKLFKEFS